MAGRQGTFAATIEAISLQMQPSCTQQKQWHLEKHALPRANHANTSNNLPTNRTMFRGVRFHCWNTRWPRQASIMPMLATQYLPIAGKKTRRRNKTADNTATYRDQNSRHRSQIKTSLILYRVLSTGNPSDPTRCDAPCKHSLSQAKMHAIAQSTDFCVKLARH